MFQSYPISEVCSLITRGISPAYDDEGIPVLSQKCIRDNRVLFDAARITSPSKKKVPHEKLIRLHDVLVNSTGVGTLGRVAQVKRLEGQIAADSHVSIVRPDPSKVDPLFFGYAMVLNQSKIEAMGEGATGQTELSRTRLGSEVFVQLPPLPIQRRIAGILSAYDELSENSQRRLQSLESMARARYRAWFVHFRFPGHEHHPRVPSPLGDIPKGWEVKKLGEIAENFDRLRKPLSKMQRAEIQGEYPYYGAAKVFDHINDFIFDGEYLLMAEDGSVITTDRAPVLQLVNEKFWPNNHTHVLRGKSPFSTHFLYLGLSEVDISPYITGAAQPKITQENMNRIPFFCAPTKLHIDFNRLVDPSIRQSQFLQRQIQNLRRTRDLLLPRLLSGQIEVEAIA